MVVKPLNNIKDIIDKMQDMKEYDANWKTIFTLHGMLTCNEISLNKTITKSEKIYLTDNEIIFVFRT